MESDIQNGNTALALCPRPSAPTPHTLMTYVKLNYNNWKVEFKKGPIHAEVISKCSFLPDSKQSVFPRQS